MNRDEYTGIVRGKYAWGHDEDQNLSSLSARQKRLDDASIISSYSWADEGKIISVYIEDAMLGMIDDDSISVLCDDKGMTVTVFFHNMPGFPSTKKLILANVYERVNAVSYKRKPGKNLVVVRLHKEDATIEWLEICRAKRSTAVINSDSDEEADEYDNQFDMQSLLQGLGNQDGMGMDGSGSMNDMQSLLQGIGGNGSMKDMGEMMRAMQSQMDIHPTSTESQGTSMPNVDDGMDMSAILNSMRQQFGDGNEQVDNMEDLLKTMQSANGDACDDSMGNECTDKISEMLKTMEGFSANEHSTEPKAN